MPPECPYCKKNHPIKAGCSYVVKFDSALLKQVEQDNAEQEQRVEIELRQDDYGNDYKHVMGKADEAEIVKPYMDWPGPAFSLELGEEVEWVQYEESIEQSGETVGSFVSGSGLRKTDKGFVRNISVAKMPTVAQALSARDGVLAELPDVTSPKGFICGGNETHWFYYDAKTGLYSKAAKSDDCEPEFIEAPSGNDARCEMRTAETVRKVSEREHSIRRVFSEFQPVQCAFRSGQIELNDCQGYTVKMDYRNLMSLMDKAKRAGARSIAD